MKLKSGHRVTEDGARLVKLRCPDGSTTYMREADYRRQQAAQPVEPDAELRAALAEHERLLKITPAEQALFASWGSPAANDARRTKIGGVK
jgi:hypothetical protein